MPTTAEDKIKYLARKCANSGLKLRDARMLLDSLIIADALAMNNGNISKAADAIRVDRAMIMRFRMRQERSILVVD